MSFLAENWFLIVAAVAALVVAGYVVITFFKMPRKEQIAKVREWLLYAVAEAEKQLGHGTGKFKLRLVYDNFIGRFPAVAQFISFESFSLLVDSALQEFNKLLESNKNIRQYVYGPDEEE